ncbi:MAG: hypothetical protein LUC94_12925, partial [Clostridiales bacterium]|nr:hypothetical protein [Clostridiales bacterium]
MAVHTYRAYHFHEFMEIVESIGTSGQMALNNPPVLWSRGHRKTDWNLLPTLIRDVNLDVLSGIPHASKRALEEELRKEHNIAKKYQCF